MPRTSTSGWSTKSGLDRHTAEAESARAAQNAGDGPQAFHRGTNDNEIQALCATLEARGTKNSRKLSHALKRQSDTVKSSLTSKEDGSVGFSLSAGSGGAAFVQHQGKGVPEQPTIEESSAR